jgi:RNase H-like domain found in reverse transcriptase/Reverse transcriptase (RNA-dependent DNA polymerase)/Integrase zinc binding domain/Retroviral aspartyl protease
MPPTPIISSTIIKKSTKKVQNKKTQENCSTVVSCPVIVKNNSPYLKIEIHGPEKEESILALADSGATESFIDHDLVRALNIPTVETPVKRPLFLIDGSPHSAGPVRLVTCPVLVTLDSLKFKVTFLVSKFPSCPVILGYPWFHKYNPSINWEKNFILFDPQTHSNEEDSVACHAREKNEEPPMVNEVLYTNSANVLPSPPTLVTDPFIRKDDDCNEATNSSDLSAIPQQYSEFVDVFSKTSAEMLPSERPFDCTIDLKDPEAPMPFKPIYNLSPKEQEAQKIYIQENLAKGFIRPSKSPAGSPQFFVAKKDGSLRPCVDYRELNALTIKDRTPLPLISDLIDRTAHAKIFTKIDLRGAYNLVRVKPGDEWKTAFRTRFGLFEYLVMPFGLTNAPAVFQRMMNTIFSDVIDVFVVIYLDDILVYSPDEESHVSHVRLVLSRLREYKLYAKLEKCEFHVSKVEFLGFVLSNGTVAMDPSKVSSVSTWPAPSSVREIQSFLGFVNFYRRFIPGFAKIAHPITSLTKKNTPFHWTVECQDAFEELKRLVTSQPILQTVDPSLPFVLQTDASDFAIGAVLSQKFSHSSFPLPVAYYSRKLLPAERNYTVHDKELLAIVAAFQHWRHYLCGSPHVIDIFSDHRNLLFFQQGRSLRPRHARWNLVLSEFDFRINYIAGASNQAADALSRRSDYLEGEHDSSDLILLPPDQFHRISSLTVRSDALNLDIDTETDWPLIIAHFLATDTWPPDIPDQLLRKCRKEAQHFRLLNSQHLEFTRSTKDGPVNYLAGKDRSETIKRYHETLGHMACDSILPLLKRRFWFPKMDDAVKSFIQECSTCQHNRSDASSARPAPLRPIPPAALPFERWGMDFVGPFPESKSGNKFILTAIDYATRWVVAKPYPDKSSRSVMDFLYKHILMEYGPPHEIITDRDKAFLEDAMPHYEQLLKIKHLPSTSYHPRTNGMVERMHQMLNHSIRCLSQDHMDRWDEFLPQTVFAIRAREHSVTKHSPFYLMYGVHPRLPVDSTPPRSTMQPLDQIEQMEERHEFIARQFDELGLARRAATERSLAQAEAMRLRNSDPDDEEVDHRFEIGDWVKLRMKKKNKWDRQWAGPFMIVKLHFPHTYFLMTFRGDWLPTPINEERLARWKSKSADELNPIECEDLMEFIDQETQECEEPSDVEDNALEGEDNLLALRGFDT